MDFKLNCSYLHHNVKGVLVEKRNIRSKKEKLFLLCVWLVDETRGGQKVGDGGSPLNNLLFPLEAFHSYV